MLCDVAWVLDFDGFVGTFGRPFGPSDSIKVDQLSGCPLVFLKKGHPTGGYELLLRNV
jgi:hypothetical protein